MAARFYGCYDNERATEKNTLRKPFQRVYFVLIVYIVPKLFYNFETVLRNFN